MRTLGRYMTLLVVGVVSSRSLAAQTAVDSAPRAVAAAYLDALNRHDWDSAAAVIDARVAAGFRRRELQEILGVAEHRKEIVRVMSRPGSGGLASMSSDDTTRMAALIAKYGAWRLPRLEGAPTIAELAALSPRAFVARALGTPEIFYVKGQWRSASIERGAKHLVGIVVESDSVAHALYHDEDFYVPPGGPDLEVEIVHLVRRGGVWGIVPQYSPWVNFLILLDEKQGLVAPPASATKPKPKH